MCLLCLVSLTWLLCLYFECFKQLLYSKLNNKSCLWCEMEYKNVVFTDCSKIMDITGRVMERFWHFVSENEQEPCTVVVVQCVLIHATTTTTPPAPSPGVRSRDNTTGALPGYCEGPGERGSPRWKLSRLYIWSYQRWENLHLPRSVLLTWIGF